MTDTCDKIRQRLTFAISGGKRLSHKKGWRPIVLPVYGICILTLHMPKLTSMGFDIAFCNIVQSGIVIERTY